GFSETGSSFVCLEPSLGQRYTVWAIDLPYHGGTRWRESTHFAKADLEAIVQQLMEENGLHTISLFGFSMGGKCAMEICHRFPGQVRELYLLASDGIKTRTVYNVAVYPAWGRSLFKSIISRPGWFFTFIRIMHRMKILSPWLYRFTMNHMDTEEKRQRLYDTWVSMANFEIDIKSLKQTIRQHAIPLKLVFGERDEVIPPAVAHEMAAGLPTATVRIIRRGHYFIDDKLNHTLEELTEI
nr:alpha/beta hydrolase [Chitinophagales bacterium]